MTKRKKGTKGGSNGTGGGRKSITPLPETNRVLTVECPYPGTWSFKSLGVEGAHERAIVKWTPSRLTERGDKRVFIGRQDKGALDTLTPEAIQLPKKGWSGQLTDRYVTTLGAGRLKILIYEKPTAKIRSTVAPQPNRPSAKQGGLYSDPSGYQKPRTASSVHGGS